MDQDEFSHEAVDAVLLRVKLSPEEKLPGLFQLNEDILEAYKPFLEYLNGLSVKTPLERVFYEIANRVYMEIYALNTFREAILLPKAAACCRAMYEIMLDAKLIAIDHAWADKYLKYPEADLYWGLKKIKDFKDNNPNFMDKLGLIKAAELNFADTELVNQKKQLLKDTWDKEKCPRYWSDKEIPERLKLLNSVEDSFYYCYIYGYLSSLIHGGPPNQLLIQREGYYLSLNIAHILSQDFFQKIMTVLLKIWNFKDVGEKLIIKCNQAGIKCSERDMGLKVAKFVEMSKKSSSQNSSE